tara:strand:+ start:78 stop:1400 length:1323 start_codon:yes stop_codon:yes gene_type:complete
METLPYDNATEDVVLGSVIRDSKEYDKVSKYFIDINVFGQVKAQKLWLKIAEMIKEGKHVDAVTINASLKDKDVKTGLNAYYIACCSGDACVAGATEFYAQKLYEKYLLRKIIIKSQDLQSKARNYDEDVYNVIAEAHTLYGELLSMQATESGDIDTIIGETIESIENKSNKLIRTGYEKLDKYAGGLTRGEITIVGGRPGHGKTTVLINLLSRALEQGHKVMFFSRELPNSELMKKIICLESGELSYNMVRKNIYSDIELDIVNQTITLIKQKYSKDKFMMFDNIRDFTLSASEVKKFKPDIIFDDYIQLIAYNGREEQRRLQLEQLCNSYKWLAKETDSVVVLASQLNRGIEYRGNNYEPQLSDLAESGAIEQVAENVFFTHYDYKVKGEAGKGKNILTISASKVRYGDTGKVDLGYDGDKCKIYNSMEEIINGEIPF